MKVLVIDDDPSVRESVSKVLRDEGYQAVTAADGPEALVQFEAHDIDLLVLDLGLPIKNGWDVFERITTENPVVPVIIITGHADVPLAVEAMKAGAAEFLEKPFDSEKLTGAVRRCAATLEVLVRENAKRAEIAQLMASLSPREAQVLDKLVEGHSNKSIAATLKISPRTVEIHRAHVMAKLGVSSMPELVKLAIAAPKS